MSAQVPGPGRPVSAKEAAIGGLIALAVVGYIFGAASPSGHQKPPKGPALMPYKITAPDLYAAYKLNEVAEQMRIGKRPVLVAGVIHSIDLDLSGSAYVALDEGNGGISHADMTLVSAEKPEAARLQRGEVVTVLCKNMERLLGDAYGRHCVIVAVRQ